MSELVSQRDVRAQPASETGFWSGMLAVLAISPGVIVFAVAFAISASTVGFTPLEVMALSALIFAGTAQLSIVALVSAGANPLVVVATAVALNLRHIMYGLSLSRWFGRLPTRVRIPVSYLLTDEMYGLTVREYARGRGSSSVALGAGLGIFTIYVLSTGAGVLFGEAIPLPEAIDLGFVFPLMFLALLVPLVRDREHLAMALLAAGFTLVFGMFVPDGLTVLLVILGTSLCWMFILRLRDREAGR